METKAREVYPSGPTVEVTIGLTEEEVVELFKETFALTGFITIKDFKHTGKYPTAIRSAIRKLRPGKYL